eukprot:symbB.v1.2.012055.t2/scaffold824.1/size159532/6
MESIPGFFDNGSCLPGEGWKNAAVSVPADATALRFKAVTGNSFRGDFALDAIVADEIAPTTPPPAGPAESISCTFESDFCKWTHPGTNTWTRRKHGTPSSGTGPSSAVQGDYYIYTEASSGNHDKDFVIETPVFAMTTPIKVQFNYHMKGSKMGDLTLSYSTGAGTLTSLFTATGSQGSDWKLAEVVLPMDAVSLTLKGHTGDGWSSDIAVDDIKVTAA